MHHNSLNNTRIFLIYINLERKRYLNVNFLVEFRKTNVCYAHILILRPLIRATPVPCTFILISEQL